MAGPFVGLNECLEHDIGSGGTPGGSFTAFSKVESGRMGYEGGDVEENIGIGGQVAYYRDMVVPSGQATTMLQSIALVSLATPASIGALPSVIAQIHGGPLVTSNAARLHEDCYLRQVKLSCQRGRPLMCDYQWLATTETEKTTIASAATKLTNTPVMWHNADVDVDSTGLKTQSWELTITNEIVAQTSQDTKVAGAERTPEWFDPGNYIVELTARTRVDPGFDFKTQFPATFDFQFTGDDNEGTPKTFDLDCTSGSGFELQGDPIELVRGGDAVLYEIRGRSVNDLSIVAVTFA